MAARWLATFNDPLEKDAFFQLFDEYLALRGTASVPAPVSRSRAPQGLAPGKQPFVPPTPVPAVSLSSRTSSFSSNAENQLAASALRNTRLTSSALQNAGVSPRLAGVASKFGASHSESLAPHLVSAARSGTATAGGGSSPPPTRGPKPPSGLQSSKTIAGGFSTTSGKDFTKSLFKSKGPMSNEEAKKNAFKDPLYVVKPRTPTYSPPLSGQFTPPSRGQTPTSPLPDNGLGQAQAAYPYAGDDEADLAVQEGEIVTVVEHVSKDWWKCRNSDGTEGLVPSSYLAML